MNESKDNAPRRTMPLWLLPCVCLPLLVLYPSEAEPMPHSPAVTAAVANAASPSIAAREEISAPAPAPTTVHVVLTRGPKRLELDLPLDGKVSPATADEIARLMRCARSGRTRRIATGTLALLADVAVRFPGHEIEIISAVRDEPDRRREGVKYSKHWSGHAIDIAVRGVKLAEVRDAMWKNHRGIGVGWYPEGGFIHIDYRPGDHDTAWTQPRPNADNQYHPRWARVARDAEAAAATWRAKMRALIGSSATLATIVPWIAEALGYQDGPIVRDRRSS